LKPQADETAHSGSTQGSESGQRSNHGRFSLGERVIVLENGYDDETGDPPPTHPIRGCVGEVTGLPSPDCDPGREFYSVALRGDTVEGTDSHHVGTWLFHAWEITHRD
jgi:hypothetical protein